VHGTKHQSSNLFVVYKKLNFFLSLSLFSIFSHIDFDNNNAVLLVKNNIESQQERLQYKQIGGGVMNGGMGLITHGLRFNSGGG
jgi:hypothetical protein